MTIFVGASANIDLTRVHQIHPASNGSLLSDEPSALLCMSPDADGLCSHQIIVRAKDLAPILFPNA